ncbi:MAG: hypothetical protein Q4F84_03765, partial [Fibrobacter sp.]|nr:hypothetical protein [Fibrobacter sp.]
MKSDYLEVYKFVAGIRRNYILKRIADGWICGGGLFLAISSLLNLLFFLYPVTVIPLVWDMLAVLYFCFAATWLVDSVFIHKLNIVETAKRIEQKGNLKHPLVSIALELKNSEPQNYFTQKAYSCAACQLSKLPHSLYLLKQWKIYAIVFAAIAWSTTNFTIDPVVADYWKMPFAFLNKGDAAVTPGTVSLPRNSSVKIQLKPSGQAFPSCVIDIASVKAGHGRKRLIRPDSTATFLYTEDSVRESFTYQFTYGGRIFNPETVWVVNPPMLYGLKMKVSPPEYTGLAEREFPEGQGDCSVYAGTKVKIELQSERLSKAVLIVNGDSCKMSIENNKVIGEFTAYNQTAYTFSLQDTFGQKNDSLPVFYVDMIPDDKPFVHFLKPGTNKIVNVNLVESLWLEAVDDLGLRSLKICYYKSGEENEAPNQWNIPVKGHVKTIQRELVWNLGELSLYPGDTVFYWAQASDYRPLKQYQVSRTDTFWFRLASFEEIHEQVVNRENSAQKTISDVR